MPHLFNNPGPKPPPPPIGWRHGKRRLHVLGWCHWASEAQVWTFLDSGHLGPDLGPYMVDLTVRGSNHWQLDVAAPPGGVPGPGRRSGLFP